MSTALPMTESTPRLRLAAAPERVSPPTEPLGPPAPIDHLVGETAWPLVVRDDGTGIITLTARGRRYDAVLVPGVRSAHVYVEIDRRREPPAEPCHAAVSRVLEAVSRMVPAVTAVFRPIDDDLRALRLEADAGDDLDTALQTLMAACVLAGPELLLLLDDQTVARQCLEHWPDPLTSST